MPPLRNERYMLDRCHVPQKDGPTTATVVGKQLQRPGLSFADINSGTGDGGGENEGEGGLHQHFEADNPSYVRRRCLPHIGWTVAKAGLKMVDCKVHDNICAYLTEGVTWFNLKSIACAPILEGGLGYCKMGDEMYNTLFGKAPGSIDDDRPESAAIFLTFLRGRERVLARCAEIDLTVRDLGEKAKRAAAAMADATGRLERSILAELLHRSLYLCKIGNCVGRLASEMTFEDLVSKASGRITDLACDTGCCLLYTSPSPRDQRGSRMPSSA